ncbi:MAG: hypothetical protein JW893_04840 [Candidatus Omnitrophica bacterium]|nr:hypothetical protein [Candidatus Omnitrophota bacterium]
MPFIGFTYAILRFIDESIARVFFDVRGKKMLERGNQVIWIYPPELDTLPKELIEELNWKSGQDYYAEKGVLHTALDLNRKNGAIPLDLAKPNKDPELVG